MNYLRFTLYVSATAALLLAGCKATTFEQTAPDGRRLRVTDRRAFFNTDARLTGAVDPTNGLLKITVEAKGAVASDSLKAVAEGVAAGVVSGLKP